MSVFYGTFFSASTTFLIEMSDIIFFFFFVITIFSSLFSQPNYNLNVLAPYKIRLKLVISFSVTIGCFL